MFVKSRPASVHGEKLWFYFFFSLMLDFIFYYFAVTFWVLRGSFPVGQRLMMKKQTVISDDISGSLLTTPDSSIFLSLCHFLSLLCKTHTQISKQTNPLACIFLYTYTLPRVHTHTHMHKPTHTRTRAHTHTSMHTSIRTHARTLWEKQQGSKCLTAIKHYKKCFYRSLIFNQESCAWRGTASFLVATTARIQPGTHTLVLVVRQHQHQPPGLLLCSQSMKMCVSMRMHYTGE